jgi:hypothetical protein
MATTRDEADRLARLTQADPVAVLERVIDERRPAWAEDAALRAKAESALRAAVLILREGRTS